MGLDRVLVAFLHNGTVTGDFCQSLAGLTPYVGGLMCVRSEEPMVFGLNKVSGFGAAFTLIRRDVLEKMAVGHEDDPYIWFKLDAAGGGGEDTYFSERVNSLGIEALRPVSEWKVVEFVDDPADN